MPFLDVPGAKLHYEVQGSGPPLLFIAGANGTGGIFHHMPSSLATDFTVITYSRRGFSLSIITGEQDYSQRLERDADDAAALLEHISPQSRHVACVFGTSSGAIVARTVLLRRSGQIRKLVCHEPPLVHALPSTEADEYFNGLRQAYAIYRDRGPVAAMQWFLKVNMTPGDVQALMAMRSLPNPDPCAGGNQVYWFERELPVYPYTDVRWEDLEKVKSKLIIAVSEQGSDLPAGRCAARIAERLGSTPLVLPGGHLGYATHGEQFGRALREALLEGHGAAKG